jgi:hypothetical protein
VGQSIPTADTETNNPRLTPNGISMRHGTKLSKQAHSSTSGSIDSGPESEEGILEGSIHKPGLSREGNREQSSANFSCSTIFSLSSFSLEELRSMISNPASRAEKIKELSALLRTLVLIGECQLDTAQRGDFVRLLDAICGEREVWYKDNRPIRFRDAVGRKFSFPWRLCKTWAVCYTNVFLYRMPH